MENNSNWRPQTPSQGGGGGEEPAVGDWRAQLVPGFRDWIINEILETLKKHLPVSGPVGLSELKKIAVRFEEKMYRVASSQSDYETRISQKMETMGTRSQNTIPIAMTSNPDVSINQPSGTENFLTSLEDLTNDVANVNIEATM